MRIAITGALGHIGSSLVRSIDCDKVIMIDNLSTERYVSLVGLPRSKKYTFYESDLLKFDFNLISNADCVVHLAGKTNAADDGVESFKVNNFLTTVEVAEFCARFGIPMVNVSTTSVYGNSRGVVDESSEVEPLTPYATAKYQAEEYLRAVTGLKFVNLRFGTIYGVSPGMRYHTAVNRFCWQAMAGYLIEIYEPALHLDRPYLYLGDAVAGINFVITNELFDGDTYNVATGNHTPYNVFQAIKEVIPDAQFILTKTDLPYFHSYSVLSDKIREKGFEFKGNLQDGVGEIVDQWSGINVIDV